MQAWKEWEGCGLMNMELLVDVMSCLVCGKQVMVSQGKWELACRRP